MNRESLPLFSQRFATRAPRVALPPVMDEDVEAVQARPCTPPPAPEPDTREPPAEWARAHGYDIGDVARPAPTGAAPARAETKSTASEPLSGRALASVSLLDLFTMDIPEPRWLVDGLIPEGPSAGFIAGQPKSWKSWLALQLALAVATGGRVLERAALPEARDVLVVNGEGGLSAGKRRLLRLAAGMGIETDPPDSRLGRVRVSICPPLDLASDLTLPEIRSELDAMDNPGLLVLDPLTRLHSVDEDKRTAMEPILTAVRRLSESYKLCTVLVHHSKKVSAGQPQGEPDFLRGSGALRGFYDFALGIRPRRTIMQATRTLDVELRDGAQPAPITFKLNVSDIMGTATLDLAQPEPEDTKVSKPQARHAQILETLAEGGTVSKADIIGALTAGGGWSEKTIGRDLGSLHRSGRIEEVGRGRYRLAGRLFDGVDE